MKFKTEKIKIEYQDLTAHKSEANLLLRQFVEVIETISKLTGHGELVITDYMRNSLHSLHHYGRALDIRVHDKSVAWYAAIVQLGDAFEKLNPRFRIQPHLEAYGTPNSHVHIELRDEK